jgi:hypothetical protein
VQSVRVGLHAAEITAATPLWCGAPTGWRCRLCIARGRNGCGYLDNNDRFIGGEVGRWWLSRGLDGVRPGQESLINLSEDALAICAYADGEIDQAGAAFAPSPPPPLPPPSPPQQPQPPPPPPPAAALRVAQDAQLRAEQDADHAEALAADRAAAAARAEEAVRRSAAEARRTAINDAAGAARARLAARGAAADAASAALVATLLARSGSLGRCGAQCRVCHTGHDSPVAPGSPIVRCHGCRGDVHLSCDPAQSSAADAAAEGDDWRCARCRQRAAATTRAGRSAPRPDPNCDPNPADRRRASPATHVPACNSATQLPTTRSTDAARESEQRERAGPPDSPVAARAAPPAARLGAPLTALTLLRRNPEAVLAAGPRFPDSDGRIANANGGPPVNADTAARAAAAVGLTVNAAVSGGVFSSRTRSSTPPAAGGDGPPYPRVSDLTLAVQRGYLTVGGVCQEEAEEVRRQHSRSTLRVTRSRSLHQTTARPGRASARPPRSFSG